MIEFPAALQMSLPVHPSSETSIAAYVDQASALLGLELAQEHRGGVIASMAVLAAAAAPLLEFPLSPYGEPGPALEP